MAWAIFSSLYSVSTIYWYDPAFLLALSGLLMLTNKDHMETIATLLGSSGQGDHNKSLPMFFAFPVPVKVMLRWFTATAKAATVRLNWIA